MTMFKRNSEGFLKHMQKTGRPLDLTGNGKAEAVVQDATFYREGAERLENVASVRRGLDEARLGLGRPFDEVFDELEREAKQESRGGGGIPGVIAGEDGGRPIPFPKSTIAAGSAAASLAATIWGRNSGGTNWRS